MLLSFPPHTSLLPVSFPTRPFPTTRLSLSLSLSFFLLQVLGGDFNAYHDFQWPIDFLLHNDPVPTPLLSDKHPCGSVFRQRESTRSDAGGDGAGGGGRRVDGGRRFRDVYPSLYSPSEHIRLKNLYVSLRTRRATDR